MDESVSKLNKSLMKEAVTTRVPSLLQVHQEDDDVFGPFSNSTLLAGFYQGWPLCVLPNSTITNISESEKLYFPLFEFVISLVLLVVVALPGLVGNFISIFILSRPQMRTSLNVILIGEFIKLFRIMKVVFFLQKSTVASRLYVRLSYHYLSTVHIEVWHIKTALSIADFWRLANIFSIWCAGLASFDSILLLTSILLFVVPSIYAYSGVGEFYYRHIHPLITPYTFVLGMTAQTSSGNHR